MSTSIESGGRVEGIDVIARESEPKQEWKRHALHAYFGKGERDRGRERVREKERERQPKRALSSDVCILPTYE